MISVVTELKTFRIAVLLMVLVASSTSCNKVATNQETPPPAAQDTVQSYGPPETLGSIGNPNVTESSGMAASHCEDDVFWTHNDSGDANLLFAFDAVGKDLGAFIVNGSTNKDWEDIASFKGSDGICYLLIGDIGNNGMNRTEMTVYKVREPKILRDKNSNAVPEVTAKAETIRFDYGGDVFDAETLMIHPASGDIYIVTKQISGAAKVFKVGNAASPQPKNTAVEVGELSAPSLPAGLFTGGDISPDGKRVVVTDYFYGYELRLGQSSEGFDGIWKGTLKRVDLGSRKQGESVCYSKDGKRIFAGSERAGSPLISVTLND